MFQQKRDLELQLQHQSNELNTTIRSQQTVKYKELITAERIQWLNKLRESICSMIETSYILGNRCLSNDHDNQYEITNTLISVKKYASLVIMMVNPNEKEFIDAVKYFVKEIEIKSDEKYMIAHAQPGSPYYTTQNERDIEISSVVDAFRDKAQKLMKDEWEKIKEEAKSTYGVNNKNNINFISTQR